MWCILKDKAKILIGFPIKKEDQVSFNSCRKYGPIMMGHMLANFKLLWTSHPRLEGLEQGVFVAEALKTI